MFLVVSLRFLALLMFLHTNCVGKDYRITYTNTQRNMKISVLTAESIPSTDYTLHIINTTSDTDFMITFASAKLYQIHIKTSDTAFTLGNKYPFNRRIIKDRNIVVPLRIANHDTTRISLSSSTSSYQSFLNTPKLESQIDARDNILLGIFFGICYIFTFFLIGLYIFSKNKFFLYYLFLSETTIFIYIYSSGIGYQYIWGSCTIFQHYAEYYLYALYLFSHILFVRLFFNTQLNFRRLDKFFIFLLGLLALFIMSTSLYIVVSEEVFEISNLIIKNLLYLLFTIYEHNLLFNYLYDFWFRFNLVASHLSLPHILFHITIIEYFLIVYYITISFYRDVKRYSLAQFQLHAIENKILTAFNVGKNNEKEELSEKLYDNLVLDINNQISYYGVTNLVLAEKLEEIKHHIISLWEKHDHSTYFSFINTYTLVSHVVKDLLEKHIAITIEQDKNTYDFIDTNNYINLYHIITEIANNIVKHAKAHHVTIHLIHNEISHLIIIQDNGIGLNKNFSKSGLGMVNMDKRIALLQGKLTIENSAQRGTTVTITLPLHLFKTIIK